MSKDKMKPSDLVSQPEFTDQFLAAAKKASQVPASEIEKAEKAEREALSKPAFHMPSAQKPMPGSLIDNAKKLREEKEEKEKAEELAEKKKEEGKFINLSKFKVAAIIGAISLLPGVSLIGAAVTISAGIWGVNKLMENKAAMDTFEGWKSSLKEKFGDTDIGKGIQDGSILESVKKLEVPEAVKTTLDAGIKNLKEGKPLDMAGKGLQNFGQLLADKAETLQASQDERALDKKVENKDLPKPPKPM